MTGSGVEAFQGAARKVAEALAADAVVRDEANRAPFAEVSALRDAGLLDALVPSGLGGQGRSWSDVLSAVRPIIRADASIGHVLTYHYLNSWRIRLNSRPGVIDELERASAANRWFWGGAGNPRDAALDLVPDGDGFRVTGRKFFATGAQVADRITASGTRVDTGEKLAIVIDGRAEGVTHHDDWDNLGQRLSASGSVSFDAVRVPDAQVLGTSGQAGAAFQPYPSLSILFFQLVLAHLHVGIAEGALATASEYVRTKVRPWATSGVELATEDPYLLEITGELVSQTAAADALTWRVTRQAEGAVARGWDLTEAERGELAVDIATAKVASTRAVNEVTSKVFELTGARATTRATGFDRFWRNARTITLHDPVVYKAREVGAYTLSGATPTPSNYS
ncbi:acyl-CoA dehydrogenase family protein [Jiangella endophytica]|uniref:acyl-CoA dehydrogenase family protein n=1 Tax=Jiangella endophytica TaxID=1623398 RepID=UPI0018E4EA88|nr:acyl-CoA dehydrogenase family protein [Jiangella endophytica]